MRLNAYIASHSQFSRRQADQLIIDGKIAVNGQTARLGQQVTNQDNIKIIDKQPQKQALIYLLFYKPTGYVVSYNGQGSPTIYDILPRQYQHLKPIGRLDKDSEGLLVLTNDGQYINHLTHPRYQKEKVYEVKLDQQLTPETLKLINNGLMLKDGLSKLKVTIKPNHQSYLVNMSEGKNRQIRRTFQKLNYKVIFLKRLSLGQYKLGDLKPGEYQISQKL